MSQAPLNALRVFESVIRCGSFVLAADELNVSQSAVSHQIRHLEDWFETPLFDRSGSRPQPLPAANQLAVTLGHSFSDIHQACQRLKKESRPLTLVIATIPSIAVCWLIPRLSDFRIRYPDLEIRVIYAFHGHDINYSDVDLAFTYSNQQPQSSDTQAHVFLPGDSAPVCSPAVKKSIDMETIDSIASLGTLLHDSDTSGWKKWLAESNMDIGEPLTGPVFEDFNLLHAAVLAGQGVALCPLAMIKSDLGSGRLVQLSTTCINEHFHYYLIEHITKNEFSRSAILSFKNWVLEQAPDVTMTRTLT